MHYITEISEVDILPEENEPLKQKEESIKSNWTGCLQTVVFCLKVFTISAIFAFQVCFLTFKIFNSITFASLLALLQVSFKLKLKTAK